MAVKDFMRGTSKKMGQDYFRCPEYCPRMQIIILKAFKHAIGIKDKKNLYIELFNTKNNRLAIYTYAYTYIYKGIKKSCPLSRWCKNA